MNWLDPVDRYCERFGPDLFAEPLNALSNLSFVAAGLWLALRMPRLLAPQPVPPAFDVLAGMIALIGICSGAFHVFATRWAELLDVLSIALFIHFFVVCFAQFVLDVRWRFAWLAAPAFVAFSFIVTRPFDAGAFNGSVGYLPALAGLALMAVGLALQRRAGAILFGCAALVFLGSLSLRSMDQLWCSQWPWGTHWAWHLLNSLTLTLALLGLVRAWDEGRRAG